MPDDSPYINGNPQTGVQGSIPPAEAFESPMRELVNVIRFNNIIPSSNDLQQVARGVRSQRMNYAEDTGSVNEYSCAYDPPITTYTIGLPLHVRIRSSNTGSSTIDAGAGRALIIRPDGMQVIAGDLPAGSVANLIYDGSRFQLMNFAGRVGQQDITINEQPIPYVVDQSDAPNWIYAPFMPEVEQLFAGLIILVKIANRNDGPTEITVNTHPRVPVYANGHGWDSNEDGSPAVRALHEGDIDRDDVKVMVFDGEAFWIEPDPPVKRFGAVDGWVRHDAVVGPLTDGTANDPARAWPTIQEAYDNLTTRFSGNPQLRLRIRLGVPGDYGGEVQFGPYPGSLSLEGDPSAPQSYRINSSSVHEGIRVWNINDMYIDGVHLWCWQNSQSAGIRAMGGSTRCVIRNVWISYNAYNAYYQFLRCQDAATLYLDGSRGGITNRCVCDARGHGCGAFVLCENNGIFLGCHLGPGEGPAYLDCYNTVLTWGGFTIGGNSRALMYSLIIRQSNVWGYQFIIGTHSSISWGGMWMPGNVWGYTYNYGVLE